MFALLKNEDKMNVTTVCMSSNFASSTIGTKPLILDFFNIFSKSVYHGLNQMVLVVAFNVWNMI